MKRLIAFVLCFALLHTAANAASAVVQTSSGTTTTCTLGSSPTAGHLVIVARDQSASGDSVSDSASNVLTEVINHYNGYLYVWAEIAPAGITGTFTATNSGSMICAEVSGATLTGVTTGTSTYTTTTNPTSGSRTFGAGDMGLCFATPQGAVSTWTAAKFGSTTATLVQSSDHYAAAGLLSMSSGSSSCNMTYGTSGSGEIAILDFPATVDPILTPADMGQVIGLLPLR